MACSCALQAGAEEDVGAIAAPNWGRSWPIAQTQGVPQELVRINLNAPQDFTLVIGDTGTQFVAGVNALMEVTVIHGSGGVSVEEKIRGLPANGLVKHVCASYVAVQAQFTGVVPLAATDTRRVSAHAGMGTPFSHRHRTLLTFTGPSLVQTIRLLPWVHSIRIVGYNGSAPTSFTVIEQTVFNTGAPVNIGTNPGTQYTAATGTPIAQDCNALLMNSGGIPLQCILEQFYDL